MEQKSKILNILDKTTFHVEHTPKNIPWFTTLPVTAKKSLFMVVIFAVFLFHVKPAGIFGVILRFFGNFKPLKNICLPVFWLFHVKHRLFFRYYVIFLIVGLFLSVFVVFLA